MQGKIISNLLSILKIDCLKTAQYKPSTNGAVEHYNRTLRSLLQKFTSENPDNYLDLLPLLSYALHTCEHPSTKVTPFFIMHGYQPRHLTSIYYGITTTPYYKSQ